jgi:hypothetical protein
LEPVDVEKLIGELEIAVDRLRSLYDQYFVGLEKLEPGVPRKDVDRRIYALRKEQIRNTALRFRFQTVLQRYNTYQTHWQRICREIENGTYKRHLIRAQRRFGSTRPPPARSIRPRASDSIAPSAPSFPGEALAPRVGFEEDSNAPSFEVDMQADDEAPSVQPASPRGASLDLSPGPAERPAAPQAPKALAAVWKKVGAGPAGAEERPSLTIPPRPAPPRPSPSIRPSLAAPAKAPPAAALKPLAGAAGKAPPPGSLVRPVPAAAANVSPGIGAPNPQGAVAKPAPAAAAGNPQGVVAKPAPAAAAGNPQGVVAKPAPAAAAAKSPGRGSAGDLSEERMRELYSEYVGAKRRQNESTAAITYQAVARSLRESSERLREKHGKAVDFEVGLKDGKAVLRPVLK